MKGLETRYLEKLSELYPTIAKASKEIINQQAILNLPKGTEHFLTDIHGEYEAFQHVLRNASGAIKRKVNEIFGNTLRESEKKELTLQNAIEELGEEIAKADLSGDEDWKAELRKEYAKLREEA